MTRRVETRHPSRRGVLLFLRLLLLIFFLIVLVILILLHRHWAIPSYSHAPSSSPSPDFSFFSLPFGSDTPFFFAGSAFLAGLSASSSAWLFFSSAGSL